MAESILHATSETHLRVEGLTHAYDGRPVLSSLDLEIGAGEIVVLVGPSGCGKSTTLRLIAGLERVQKGHIALGGRAVADSRRFVPPEERDLSLMFQDYALFPHMTVLDNVAFGVKRLRGARRRERAMAALEDVGLDHMAKAHPHILSGGQQQRVALARALAPRPRLMLLDEPFSGLDTRLREHVRDETMHLLKSHGIATLMVTHDPEEALFMADRLAVMRDGRIEQLGRPSDVYFKPATPFVATFFSEVNELDAVIRDGRAVTDLGELPAGREMQEGAPAQVLVRPEGLHLVRPEDAAGRPLVRVQAARLLGRTSLVHLTAEGVKGRMHLHARVFGLFLPDEGSQFAVRLDPLQAHIFPTENGVCS